MITIYKYPLKVADVQTIELPLNAEILTVQFQQDTLCLWAKVETDNRKTKKHTIEVYGTGHEMPYHDRRHIGTVQMLRGSLVWHVFEQI